MSLETITTISPTTNKSVHSIAATAPGRLEELPKTATAAFESWRTTPLSDRQAIVKKALAGLTSKRDELAKELTEHMGRPISYTGKEIDTAVKRGEYMLKISGEVLDGKVEGEKEKGFQRYLKKVPVGPVLIIFAWNYPYLILMNAIVPALLAGNTVILKPSPQTPTVGDQFKSIFAEAGLPENVIQTCQIGSFTSLETLIRNPDIKLVCFTGSVAVGLQVQAAASDRIVNVGLELGGKDPAYVRQDVNVAWAAEEIVDGSVFNSGQSCCALERIYVHESVHDEFVEKIKDVLKGYKVGDPSEKDTNLGPVISKKAKEMIESHIEDAIKKGAKDETPDNESFSKMPEEGNYVKPTLLTGATHDMTVMTAETFGPVIPVMKVKDDKEAIKYMNDSEFGLTASIWTKDVETGEKLAEDVEAGTVFVNRCDFPSPDLAWTGWKNSGRGVTLSRFGFDQFVKLKSYHIKDYPK